MVFKLGPQRAPDGTRLTGHAVQPDPHFGIGDRGSARNGRLGLVLGLTYRRRPLLFGSHAGVLGAE